MERLCRVREGPEWVEIVRKAFPEEGKRGPVHIKGCAAELVVRTRILEADPLGTKPACGLLAA